MKNKLSNILRSSCNELKRRHFNAATDVGAAEYSSFGAERSLVSHFSECDNFVFLGF